MRRSNCACSTSPTVSQAFHYNIDRLIDWVEFEKKVESIAISYNDEFIATSHEDQIGISIWANNSYYQDIVLEKIPAQPSTL